MRTVASAFHTVRCFRKELIRRLLSPQAPETEFWNDFVLSSRDEEAEWHLSVSLILRRNSRASLRFFHAFIPQRTNSSYNSGVSMNLHPSPSLIRVGVIT